MQVPPEKLLEFWTSKEVLELVEKSKGQFIAVMGRDFQDDGRFQLSSIAPPGFMGGVLPYALREFLSRIIIMCDQMTVQDEVIKTQKTIYTNMLTYLDNCLVGNTAPTPPKKEMN